MSNQQEQEYEQMMNELPGEDVLHQQLENDWQEEVEHNSIAALELFELGLSKTEIKMMANNAVQSVLQQGNPLQVAEALSAMEAFIKEVKEDARFKDYVREETIKHIKGFTSNSGARIEVAEVGSKYDYTKCGDPLYLDYLRDVEDANTQLKLHQDFLKTIPFSGVEVVRGDEVVKIYPPSKSSTSSYKITLAK